MLAGINSFPNLNDRNRYLDFLPLLLPPAPAGIFVGVTGFASAFFPVLLFCWAFSCDAAAAPCSAELFAVLVAMISFLAVLRGLRNQSTPSGWLRSVAFDRDKAGFSCCAKRRLVATTNPRAADHATHIVAVVTILPKVSMLYGLVMTCASRNPSIKPRSPYPLAKINGIL